MKKKQKIIIGQILFQAEDKRQRLLNDDQIAWLEEKMAEIVRLTKMLPYIKYTGKNRV